tara:strand:+ start:246 stop:479 length:234 start_codon:yes stop_codon:yes gene_type:complete
MNDMKDYMISKNKAEEYARKLTNAEYEKNKALIKQDVILDAIIAEARSMLCDYQDTMSKDIEQSLRNLIDQIEGYKQ